MSDDEPLATPPGTTDMELKIKQVCMESSVLLACFAGGGMPVVLRHGTTPTNAECFPGAILRNIFRKEALQLCETNLL